MASSTEVGRHAARDILIRKLGKHTYSQLAKGATANQTTVIRVQGQQLVFIHTGGSCCCVLSEKPKVRVIGVREDGKPLIPWEDAVIALLFGPNVFRDFPKACIRLSLDTP